MALEKNAKSMEGYFGIRPNKDYPYNASQLGLTINDRKLMTKKNSETGLRENLIPFQFLGDEVPPKPKTANFDDVSIPGRFESVKSYQNSSSSDISLKVIYVAFGTKKRGHKTFWTIENIEAITRKLEALPFPNYSVKFDSPYLCLLNMGSIFIDYPVRIKSVTVSNKAPFDLADITARTKEINIELVSSYPIWQPLEAQDIMFSDSGNRVFAYKKFSQTKLR